jgi:hypothetical protein
MYWSVYKATPLRETGGCAITCHHAPQVIPIIVGQVSVGKAQWDEALQIAEMVNRPYERLRHRDSNGAAPLVEVVYGWPDLRALVQRLQFSDILG